MATTRWLAGMRITAARLDELLNPPTFCGRQTVEESIVHADFQEVTLGAADVDTDGGWDVGSPMRYTVQVSGMYELSGSVAYEQNGTGGRGMAIRVNGSVFVPGAGAFVGAASSTVTVVAGAPRPWYLDAGDYVELCAYQASGGGTLDTFLAGDQASCLTVRRIRGSA